MNCYVSSDVYFSDRKHYTQHVPRLPSYEKWLLSMNHVYVLPNFFCHKSVLMILPTVEAIKYRYFVIVFMFANNYTAGIKPQKLHSFQLITLNSFIFLTRDKEWQT